MPGARSVEVFRVDGGTELDQLENTALGYSDEVDNQNVGDPLRIQTEDINTTEDSLYFVLKFETAIKRSTWDDSENSWIRRTHSQRFLFSEDILDGGFIIIGTKRKRKVAISRLARLLEVDPNDDIEQISIPMASIEEIEDFDAQSRKSLAADDPDEYTSKASATGDFDHGLASDVDDGDHSWVMYSSREYGGLVVGVSQSGLVFYGDEWTQIEMLSYITDIVLPRLP